MTSFAKLSDFIPQTLTEGLEDALAGLQDIVLTSATSTIARRGILATHINTVQKTLMLALDKLFVAADRVEGALKSVAARVDADYRRLLLDHQAIQRDLDHARVLARYSASPYRPIDIERQGVVPWPRATSASTAMGITLPSAFGERAVTSRSAGMPTGRVSVTHRLGSQVADAFSIDPTTILAGDLQSPWTEIVHSASPIFVTRVDGTSTINPMYDWLPTAYASVGGAAAELTCVFESSIPMTMLRIVPFSTFPIVPLSVKVGNPYYETVWSYGDAGVVDGDNPYTLLFAEPVVGDRMTFVFAQPHARQVPYITTRESTQNERYWQATLPQTGLYNTPYRSTPITSERDAWAEWAEAIYQQSGLANDETIRAIADKLGSIAVMLDMLSSDDDVVVTERVVYEYQYGISLLETRYDEYLSEGSFVSLPIHTDYDLREAKLNIDALTIGAGTATVTTGYERYGDQIYDQVNREITGLSEGAATTTVTFGTGTGTFVSGMVWTRGSDEYREALQVTSVGGDVDTVTFPGLLDSSGELVVGDVLNYRFRGYVSADTPTISDVTEHVTASVVLSDRNDAKALEVYEDVWSRIAITNQGNITSATIVDSATIGDTIVVAELDSSGATVTAYATTTGQSVAVSFADASAVSLECDPDSTVSACAVYADNTADIVALEPATFTWDSVATSVASACSDASHTIASTENGNDRDVVIYLAKTTYNDTTLSHFGATLSNGSFGSWGTETANDDVRIPPLESCPLAASLGQVYLPISTMETHGTNSSSSATLTVTDLPAGLVAGCAGRPLDAVLDDGAWFFVNQVNADEKNSSSAMLTVTSTMGLALVLEVIAVGADGNDYHMDIEDGPGSGTSALTVSLVGTTITVTLGVVDGAWDAESNSTNAFLLAFDAACGAYISSPPTLRMPSSMTGSITTSSIADGSADFSGGSDSGTITLNRTIASVGSNVVWQFFTPYGLDGISGYTQENPIEHVIAVPGLVDLAASVVGGSAVVCACTPTGIVSTDGAAYTHDGGFTGIEMAGDIIVGITSGYSTYILQHTTGTLASVSCRNSGILFSLIGGGGNISGVALANDSVYQFSYAAGWEWVSVPDNSFGMSPLDVVYKTLGTDDDGTIELPSFPYIDYGQIALYQKDYGLTIPYNPNDSSIPVPMPIAIELRAGNMTILQDTSGSIPNVYGKPQLQSIPTTVNTTDNQGVVLQLVSPFILSPVSVTTDGQARQLATQASQLGIQLGVTNEEGAELVRRVQTSTTRRVYESAYKNWTGDPMFRVGVIYTDEDNIDRVYYAESLSHQVVGLPVASVIQNEGLILFHEQVPESLILVTNGTAATIDASDVKLVAFDFFAPSGSRSVTSSDTSGNTTQGIPFTTNVTDYIGGRNPDVAEHPPNTIIESEDYYPAYAYTQTGKRLAFSVPLAADTEIVVRYRTLDLAPRLLINLAASKVTDGVPDLEHRLDPASSPLITSCGLFIGGITA